MDQATGEEHRGMNQHGGERWEERGGGGGGGGEGGGGRDIRKKRNIESTSGSDGSATWGRWSGSQHEQQDGSNSKSSRTVCEYEGSEIRSSFLQGSLGCSGGGGGGGGGMEGKGYRCGFPKL